MSRSQFPYWRGWFKRRHHECDVRAQILTVICHSPTSFKKTTWSRSRHGTAKGSCKISLSSSVKSADPYYKWRIVHIWIIIESYQYIHMSSEDSTCFCNVLFVVISIADSSIKEKRCESILIDFKIVFFSPHYYGEGIRLNGFSIGLY